MLLKNKNALITGSNRGIGFSILTKFSENGANIVACARKKTDEVENKILELQNKYKNNIKPIYFDLLKRTLEAKSIFND